MLRAVLQVRRLYHSVTAGVPKELEGTVRTNIGRHPMDRKLMTAFTFGAGRGKEAISQYRCVVVPEATYDRVPQ